MRAWKIALAMVLLTGGALAHDTSDAGRPGRAADVERTIRITVNDTKFSVAEIDVHPGETIRFTVVNLGKIDHEFSVATHAEHLAHRKMMAEMPDMKHNDPNMIQVKPGEIKNLVWKFGARRSDLEFACDIPGHADAGMQGKFVFAP